jgi:hypothetical protein
MAPAAIVGTEAKIDAHVDIEQLVNLARETDQVILLITPEHTGADSAVDQVLRETGKLVRVCYWGDVLDGIPNPVARLLSDNIRGLTTLPSTKVRISAALEAALAHAKPAPPGWYRRLALTADNRPCIQLDSPTGRVRAQLEGPRDPAQEREFCATVGFCTDVVDVATFLPVLYESLHDNPHVRTRIRVSESMSRPERGQCYGVPPWCARGYPDYLGIRLQAASDVLDALRRLEEAACLLEEIADDAGRR